MALLPVLVLTPLLHRDSEWIAYIFQGDKKIGCAQGSYLTHPAS